MRISSEILNEFNEYRSFLFVFLLNSKNSRCLHKEKVAINKVIKDLPPIGKQPTLGKEDAQISVVEFGDYKCPARKAWGERIFPQLQKDYIDTGKVKFSPLFFSIIFVKHYISKKLSDFH
ncbi:thioredoxin family protein [Bacillus clarus]|uniref:Thioredoxin family protein n=1 Tax=Bacillus clarus TaxID=2338372 RepID=A0A090Z2A3_9BACI|nr:thioredoxin family protein [Bacillus clarus]